MLVAFHNRKDANHGRARGLVKRILGGALGTAYASDYVFDEAVTVSLARTGRSEIALSVGRMILGEATAPFLILFRVGDAVFAEGWRLFSRYAEKG